MKKERRFAAMVEALPTDARLVLKCGPAEPMRMKRTRVWGIHAHLVGCQQTVHLEVRF